MTFTWTRGTGRAERQAATQPDIRRLPSPFLHMQTTSTEERHLLSATRFVVPDVASDHGVDLAEPAGSAGVLLILAPDRPQNTVESIWRLAARCAGRGFA
jgi:hypothetical protein